MIVVQSQEKKIFGKVAKNYFQLDMKEKASVVDNIIYLPVSGTSGQIKLVWAPVTPSAAIAVG